MEKLKNIINWILEKVVSNLMILFYIILVISLFLQVFTRYILKMPIFWTDELSRYMFIWIIFLGSGIAFSKDSHIRVRLLIKKLPQKFKMLQEIIIKVLLICYLILVTVKGFELIQFVKRQTTPALEISRAYPYSAVLVGSIIMILGLLCSLIKDLHGWKNNYKIHSFKNKGEIN